MRRVVAVAVLRWAAKPRPTGAVSSALAQILWSQKRSDACPPNFELERPTPILMLFSLRQLAPFPSTACQTLTTHDPAAQLQSI